jgi:transposase
MKFIDWRKESQETQEAIRKQAVIDVVEGGEAPKDVIRILGITESRLYEWLGKYRSGGLAALDSLPHPGKKPLLSQDQAAWVAEIVCNKVPQDFGYETKLWTRGIIAELIKQQFGIELSKSTAGRLSTSI